MMVDKFWSRELDGSGSNFLNCSVYNDSQCLTLLPLYQDKNASTQAQISYVKLSLFLIFQHSYA